MQLSRRTSRLVENVLCRIGLLILIGFALFPVVWMLTMSIKTRVDALAMPPRWVFTPTLDNYRKVLLGGEFPHFFVNSVVVAVASISIGLAVGVPAAYVLARYQFRGKKDLGFWILSTRMAPPVIVLLPFYMMFRKLDMIDTLWGLIIMHVVLNLALIIWVTRGFFLEIPREMEEASLVDGCGKLGAMTRIAIPLVLPGVAATAILAFIFSWNELMFAIIMTQNAAKTAPAGIYNFISYEEIEWGPLAAAGMIVMIPVVAFAMMVQRNMVRGLTFGALKQ